MGERLKKYYGKARKLAHDHLTPSGRHDLKGTKLGNVEFAKEKRIEDLKKQKKADLAEPTEGERLSYDQAEEIKTGAEAAADDFILSLSGKMAGLFQAALTEENTLPTSLFEGVYNSNLTNAEKEQIIAKAIKAASGEQVEFAPEEIILFHEFLAVELARMDKPDAMKTLQGLAFRIGADKFEQGDEFAECIIESGLNHAWEKLVDPVFKPLVAVLYGPDAVDKITKTAFKTPKTSGDTVTLSSLATMDGDIERKMGKSREEGVEILESELAQIKHALAEGSNINPLLADNTGDSAEVSSAKKKIIEILDYHDEFARNMGLGQFENRKKLEEAFSIIIIEELGKKEKRKSKLDESFEATEALKKKALEGQESRQHPAFIANANFDLLHLMDVPVHERVDPARLDDLKKYFNIFPKEMIDEFLIQHKVSVRMIEDYLGYKNALHTAGLASMEASKGTKFEWWKAWKERWIVKKFKQWYWSKNEKDQTGRMVYKKSMLKRRPKLTFALTLLAAWGLYKGGSYLYNERDSVWSTTKSPYYWATGKPNEQEQEMNSRIKKYLEQHPVFKNLPADVQTRIKGEYKQYPELIYFLDIPSLMLTSTGTGEFSTNAFYKDFTKKLKEDKAFSKSVKFFGAKRVGKIVGPQFDKAVASMHTEKEQKEKPKSLIEFELDIAEKLFPRYLQAGINESRTTYATAKKLMKDAGSADETVKNQAWDALKAQFAVHELSDEKNAKFLVAHPELWEMWNAGVAVNTAFNPYTAVQDEKRAFQFMDMMRFVFDNLRDFQRMQITSQAKKKTRLFAGYILSESAEGERALPESFIDAALRAGGLDVSMVKAPRGLRLETVDVNSDVFFGSLKDETRGYLENNETVKQLLQSLIDDNIFTAVGAKNANSVVNEIKKYLETTKKAVTNLYNPETKDRDPDIMQYLGGISAPQGMKVLKPPYVYIGMQARPTYQMVLDRAMKMVRAGETKTVVAPKEEKKEVKPKEQPKDKKAKPVKKKGKQGLKAAGKQRKADKNDDIDIE